MIMKWLHQIASPKYFYHFSGKLLPWLIVSCMFLFIYGLIGALYLSPADYQQGEGYRIIYIHVPAALMSLGIYMLMAFAAMIAFVYKIKLADMVVKVSASLGAWFTALALISGSIWGKPMWGTWWVWDARLTSELILLFLYLGVIALRSNIPDRAKADSASGLLAMVGIVNLPIIHYSVYWWNTLHQGSSLRLFGHSTIAPAMLYPLLAMIFAFVTYFVILLIINLRSEILLRENHTQWVKTLC